jgi:two-component system alkaline phosphatase synthesis response regulator PhoP
LAEQIRQHSILIADDEDFLRNSIRLNLELEGYSVEEASDGAQAFDIAINRSFDLLIVDVMMPRMDGMEVCRRLREAGVETPIFFLTARQSGQDRIQGLRLGADDYLTKPFELEELLLRVERLLKRRTGGSKKQQDVSINGRIYFPGSMEVEMPDKRRISLNRKEAEILNLLLRREAEVISREVILDAIWGTEVFPTPRTVDNYIMNLRKVFEDNPRRPKHILSVRSVGYKFRP